MLFRRSKTTVRFPEMNRETYRRLRWRRWPIYIMYNKSNDVLEEVRRVGFHQAGKHAWKTRPVSDILCVWYTVESVQLSISYRLTEAKGRGPRGVIDVAFYCTQLIIFSPFCIWRVNLYEIQTGKNTNSRDLYDV